MGSRRDSRRERDIARTEGSVALIPGIVWGWWPCLRVWVLQITVWIGTRF